MEGSCAWLASLLARVGFAAEEAAPAAEETPGSQGEAAPVYDEEQAAAHKKFHENLEEAWAKEQEAKAQEEADEPPWKKARSAEAPSEKWQWNSVDRKWEKVNPSSSSWQSPQQQEQQQWTPPSELDLRWCDCCRSYGYLRKKACVNYTCVCQLQSIYCQLLLFYLSFI